jgi:hypothetical protein
MSRISRSDHEFNWDDWGHPRLCCIKDCGKTSHYIIITLENDLAYCKDHVSLFKS